MLAGVEILAVLVRELAHAVLVEHVLAHQAFGVKGGRCFVGLDLLVHHRLGRRGLVGLVVAQAAVADQVDDHVLVEGHAVVQRQLGDEQHGLGVVTVDVEDGRLDHLGDVGAVQGRAGIERVRGSEADLVVDHHVDRAAGAVAAHLAELQAFQDHALAGEGGVAVDHDRHHLLERDLVAALAAAFEPGPDRTLDHRINDLQVRGVEGQGKVHRAARRLDVGREALVVLDVAGAGHARLVLALELLEQLRG